MSTTVEHREIQRFSKESGQWWNERGPYASMHKINPVRMEFLLQTLTSHFGNKKAGKRPLEGLSILDAGCGGGLACEPLARLGATVTGVDADPRAIEIAKAHASEHSLEINYVNTTTDELVRNNAKDKTSEYDAVLALEIIEHVSNMDLFVQNCSKLCRPGGVLVFSTLNRTPKSFALGIISAEYILRWVPRGTHNWRKFVRPSEFARCARRHGLKQALIKGLVYNPFSREFEMSDRDFEVNYISVFTK